MNLTKEQEIEKLKKIIEGRMSLQKG